MTDPHGMAKLDPKGNVGTIYAGDHKTMLYTKYINYWPQRKDFLKCLYTRAVDHQGLGQFAPRGLVGRKKVGEMLPHYYMVEDFFSIRHVAILIPGVWPFFTPGA